MPETTWTKTPEIETEWSITTHPETIGNWGEAWGVFAWGVNTLSDSFTKVVSGILTTWTKLP